jgi:hypothetical protein
MNTKEKIERAGVVAEELESHGWIHHSYCPGDPYLVMKDPQGRWYAFHPGSLKNGDELLIRVAKTDSGPLACNFHEEKGSILLEHAHDNHEDHYYYEYHNEQEEV